MDFTTNNETYSQMIEPRNFVEEANVDRSARHEIEKRAEMKKELFLAKENIDLIDLCIATKSETYLSKEEMRQYGVLALNTAAMDVADESNFRTFARRRIELTLNKAIAEAYLIQELLGNISDSNQVGMEFASIEETYCYN